MYSSVQHDEHFLTRIERLEQEHAELALGLYHDSQLVQFILSKVGLPEGCERAAISLDDPREGPFIVVARDGHFVTCLGRGMKLSGDRPVVTRARLDRLSTEVTGLRELVNDAKADSMAKTSELIGQVVTAGGQLSRESYQFLARWAPLLGLEYLRNAMGSAELAVRIWEKIEGARNCRAPRRRELVRAYWQTVWSVAHFSLLLCENRGEQLGRALDILESSGRFEGPRTSVYPWALARLGVTGFAARGAWIAGKLPKILLSDLKKAYANPSSINTTLSPGIGLFALGLRHRRYRNEVGKLLARPLQPDLMQIPEMAPVLKPLRETINARYQAATAGDDRAEPVVAPALRDQLLKNIEKKVKSHAAWTADLSDDLLMTVCSRIPGPVYTGSDTTALQNLLSSIVWHQDRDASSFYLPEAYNQLYEEMWKGEERFHLVQARLIHEGPLEEDLEARRQPGRNARCPCNSGKKYKRCCGAPKRVSNPPNFELTPVSRRWRSLDE